PPAPRFPPPHPRFPPPSPRFPPPPPPPPPRSPPPPPRTPPSPPASHPAPPLAALPSPVAPPVSPPASLTVSQAAANATECGVPTNLTCACTNADFQFKSSSCLQAECKPEDLVAALGLQQQQCAPLSLSATASPSATAPFTPSNAGADISAASTGSSAGSSGSPSSTPGSALSLFAPNGGKGPRVRGGGCDCGWAGWCCCGLSAVKARIYERVGEDRKYFSPNERTIRYDFVVDSKTR
ncbi:hypothetical protein B0H14DRAFT_3884487, partial [Mycena olivaceomarginata]